MNYMEHLSEKAKQMRNAYARQWKSKNPEKIREYNRRYWEKKAAEPENEVMELHRQGLTQRQIAKELNISVGKVNKLLKQI